MAATIERAEKQIILARHARRLLNYIDDSPVVPGDARAGYEHESEARQVLEDAEADLRAWESSVEPITSAARGASLSDQGEVASVNNGDSMVNDVPSAAKQMEEPQSAKSEAEPVPY